MAEFDGVRAVRRRKIVAGQRHSSVVRMKAMESSNTVSSKMAASTMRNTNGFKSTNPRLQSPFTHFNNTDGFASPINTSRQRGNRNNESRVLALLGNLSSHSNIGQSKI